MGTGDYEGMVAETTTVVGHGGDPVTAYFARPLGPGPFPAVVLFHHLPGWDEWYREATRRFAHHGYLAISPDLYARVGAGDPDDVAATVRAHGGVPDDQVVGDGRGAIEFLRSLPTASGKVGLFGTCSGARHAFLTACRVGGAEAVVDCWGGGIVPDDRPPSDKQPVPPIEYVADLPCPLLGIYGNDDGRPNRDAVDTLEAALRDHGKTYEMHRYDDAGHGFFYYDRPAAYRAEQAVDGWSKIWDFLTRTLR